MLNMYLGQCYITANDRYRCLFKALFMWNMNTSLEGGFFFFFFFKFFNWCLVAIKFFGSLYLIFLKLLYERFCYDVFIIDGLETSVS